MCNISYSGESLIMPFDNFFPTHIWHSPLKTCLKLQCKLSLFMSILFWSAFKDGGKEKRKDPTSSSVKCYFVNMDSFVQFYKKLPGCENVSVHQARCIFMHVHTVSSISSYMIRLVRWQTPFLLSEFFHCIYAEYAFPFFLGQVFTYIVKDY